MDGSSPIFHTILLEATIVTSHLVPPTMLIMIVMSALITILHNLSTTVERIKVWQVGTYPCFCLVLTSAKSQKFQGCVVRHYSPVNKEYGIYQWKRQLMICVNTLPPFYYVYTFSLGPDWRPRVLPDQPLRPKWMTSEPRGKASASPVDGPERW